MEKNQYKLCLEVFSRMDKAGFLGDVILIGSWCLPFYKDYFKGIDYFPSIRTRDVDFLVPNPKTLRSSVKAQDLVKDLGFIIGFRGREGYMVLEHPDLAVEFLVPERGKGSDKPVPLPSLGFNAQGLRFLELLSKDTIVVAVEGISLTLPHPVNFALHKLIISARRSQGKGDKDRAAAVNILKSLIAKKEDWKIVKLFDSCPPRWRSAILKELRLLGEESIVNLLAR